VTARREPSTTAAPDITGDWLLSSAERGNPATTIDAGRDGGRAWTVGNQVDVHVDGAAYFARLHELLSGLGAGDWVYLTDWRIDATRQLADPGSQLGPLLAGLARRGVAIRGLLWRSHPALDVLAVAATGMSQKRRIPWLVTPWPQQTISSLEDVHPASGMPVG